MPLEEIDKMTAVAIHHIALTVNDWSRSKPFYEEVRGEMGAREAMRGEGAPH